ncbi:MAG: hypothetical protein FJ104_16850, partial [Deltaproteobacteria bacterium]|nr:hypothetical protein [Deltaproteobacteria bacterium]
MSADAPPGPRVTLAAVVALDVTRLLVGLVVALPPARVLGSALATARTLGDGVLV